MPGGRRGRFSAFPASRRVPALLLWWPAEAMAATPNPGGKPAQEPRGLRDHRGSAAERGTRRRMPCLNPPTATACRRNRCPSEGSPTSPGPHNEPPDPSIGRPASRRRARTRRQRDPQGESSPEDRPNPPRWSNRAGPPHDYPRPSCGVKVGRASLIPAQPFFVPDPTPPNPMGTRCPSFHRFSVSSATECSWHGIWPWMPAANS
jgi:hypothetical protein